MKKHFLALSALLALGFSLTPAEAAITLNIDTTAQEFYFSGSDTGTGSQIGVTDTSFVMWYKDGIGNRSSFDIETAFTAAVEVYDGFLAIGSNNYEIALYFNTTDEVTVTANESVRFYYGAMLFAPEGFTNLAASLTPAPVDLGTGFSPVQPAAVPEPSTYALVGLGAAAVALRLIRRRKTA